MFNQRMAGDAIGTSDECDSTTLSCRDRRVHCWIIGGKAFPSTVTNILADSQSLDRVTDRKAQWVCGYMEPVTACPGATDAGLPCP